jgi:hypothetical protein
VAEIHNQLQAEGIVKVGHCMLIDGKRAHSGHLYVTRERVVFLKANAGLGAFGAIGGLPKATMTPSNAAADIPLREITGVERGKFGRNKNILEISGSDGNSVRFVASPYEEWEQAVKAGGSQLAA